MSKSKKPDDIGLGYSPTVFSPTEVFDPVKVKSRHYAQTAAFIFCSALFCFCYFAFILLALQFQNGYTNVGNAPPGIWNSARYNWQWWAVWCLSLNLLLPYMLAMALCNNTMSEYADLHGTVAQISYITNIFAFIILSGSWFFACNTGWSAYDSSCNDVRYCCVFFADNPGWCPNFNFCTPNVSASQLMRSSPFFGAWLFSLLFLLWTWGHLKINRAMRRRGLFQSH